MIIHFVSTASTSTSWLRIQSANSFRFALTIENQKISPAQSPLTRTPTPSFPLITSHITPRKKERKKKIMLTLISQNPYRSSKNRYGFFAPPSLSISPAHTLQLTGLSFSAPRTSPTETTKRETRASITMSSGRAGDEVVVVVDVKRTLL